MDELPDHDYDYIDQSVFQEGNLAGNPQLSIVTTGEDASEVGFELTPCEAYGPVTVPMHDDN